MCVNIKKCLNKWKDSINQNQHVERICIDFNRGEFNGAAEDGAKSNLSHISNRDWWKKLCRTAKLWLWILRNQVCTWKQSGMVFSLFNCWCWTIYRSNFFMLSYKTSSEFSFYGDRLEFRFRCNPSEDFRSRTAENVLLIRCVNFFSHHTHRREFLSEWWKARVRWLWEGWEISTDNEQFSGWLQLKELSLEV